MFFNNDTAVNVTVRFPTFKMSLVYDPNFAVLLGYTGSGSCDPLLTWILPASFLGGAAAIILVVLALSYLPVVRPVILGAEGTRVHNLREFIGENRLRPGSMVNIEATKDKYD
jgi:hypothetical protein